MDYRIKEQFLSGWEKYFNNAPLPLVFFYSDVISDAQPADKKGPHCMICQLPEVMGGKSIWFDVSRIHCAGGKRYSGFPGEMRRNFEYFLSCGIPGVMEGERYKRDPDLVKIFMDDLTPVTAKAKYLIFKRWDNLSEMDMPAGVLFFATPDVLAGLFTLANFDREDSNGVIAPFSSGCGSILMKVLLEEQNEKPGCILGMFDPSARPCIDPGVRSFAVPCKRFLQMVENMEESFLTTEAWNKVKNRINPNSN
jgi:hypothetical protein